MAHYELSSSELCFGHRSLVATLLLPGGLINVLYKDIYTTYILLVKLLVNDLKSASGSLTMNQHICQTCMAISSSRSP